MGWLADISQVIASDIELTVQIEQVVANDALLVAIHHYCQKRIEPAGSDQNLIEPIERIPINIVDIVDAWHAEEVQIESINIRPYIRLWLRVGGHIPHRSYKAGLEFLHR